ncbi:type II toxin-antitoxin system RelE/ParE family toxin [Flavobacterium sp. HNIBRBA15423]|uniref:type II toxin-antitoxin system RelE/ParE family toxin n=1 Tax=Flavobacterium sp. HNIBRBA15423 TaxID=3458683 RepID=UPI00404505AB
MKLKPVIWSDKSVESLELIYNYIFENSPQNAEYVITTLLEISDSLNVFPEKYPKEPLFDDETIRFFPKWNFKIIYKIEENRIFIVNIYSTRTNLF